MKKTINVKALGIIIVVVGVLGVGTHFLHGYQVRSNAGMFLSQAERAEEKKNYSEAISNLSRYLSMVPTDTEARVQFALLLANDKVAVSPRATQRAFFALSWASELAPDRADVRRRLVQFAMKPTVERYTDALAHLDKLPAAGELLGWRALCYEETGNYGPAREYYEKTIDTAPKTLTNYVRLAGLLQEKPAEVRKTKDEDTVGAAQAVINAMVAANPTDYRAYLERARFLQRELFQSLEPERVQAAIERDILAARQLAPDTLEVILAVAHLAREKGEPGSARELLRASVKRQPKEWSLVQALAQVELADGNLQAATDCLHAGLESLPDQVDLLWNYAHLLIQQRLDQDAVKVIAKLGNAGMQRAELDYLEARLLFNHDSWSEAAAKLEYVYPLFLSGHQKRKDWFSFNLALECSYLLGQCYEQLGDPYRAAAAYDRVVVREPRSSAGRLGLARMKWALGQLDVAEREYRTLIQQNDAPAIAWVQLAQLMISRNLAAENPNWRAVSDVIALARKRPEKLRPEAAALALVQAEALAAQKDYRSARQGLEQAKGDKQTQGPAVWIGLAGVEVLDGKIDAALAILDEAKRAVGDRVEVRVARARVWARRGGPEATAALVELEQPEAQGKPVPIPLLRALAEAHGRIGNLKEAARLWREVVSQRENDLGSRMTLFDLALAAGDTAGMQEQINAIRRIEGREDGTLWRYCLACQRIWEAERGNKDGLAEAASLLKTVADRRPGWSRVALAQGQVDDLRGNQKAAVANYQRAVLLGEQRPAIIQQLVRVLTERREHAAAEQILRKMLAQSPGLLNGLERPAAEIAFENHRDVPKAIALAIKAVPPESKDYRDHLWLGNLRWRAGMPKDAEESLRRAVALAPDEPDAWVALVRYGVLTNDKAKAEDLLRQAETKLSKGKALLPLATCHEMIGDVKRAEELLKAARTAKPDDPAVLAELARHCLRTQRGPEAKGYLEQLRTLPGVPTRDVAWALRALALLTAADGGNQKAVDALRLLGMRDEDLANAPAVEDNIENARARMIILANQPAVSKRRQAVAILEDMVRGKVATAQEQFLLAKLDESVGDWRKARGVMLILLNTAEQNLERAITDREKDDRRLAYAEYLSYFALGLLRHGEIVDAHLWRAKLKQIEPTSARTLEVDARLLAKDGNAASAVKSLQDLAEREPKSVLAVANLLEQIGQIEPARAMFEKYASAPKEPNRVLALAAFLARQDRAGEALDVCDRAWQTCPAEAVGSTAVAVVYLAKSSQPFYARVADKLEQAMAAHSDKTVLATSLAAVRRLQNRHDDAVALLRQVSARDQGDSLVLNNIAWILALQGKADEALATVGKAIVIRGEQANLLDTRAVAYLAKGKAAPAINDLEIALAETPTAARYFHLARAQYLAGNVGAAREALGKAQQLKLSEASVDPLEVPAYRELVAKLQQR